MTIHHRKSAALAIDGQLQTDLAPSQYAAIDIDDINIWLHHYLHEHGTVGVSIQDDTTFSAAGLDAAACTTLLAAFEYRYSVRIAKLSPDCFSSIKACAEYLLAQITAAPLSDQETTAYEGTRHMVRTLTSPH